MLNNPRVLRLGVLGLWGVELAGVWFGARMCSTEAG